MIAQIRILSIKAPSQWVTFGTWWR